MANPAGVTSGALSVEAKGAWYDTLLLYQLHS